MYLAILYSPSNVKNQPPMNADKKSAYRCASAFIGGHKWFH
ncbi:MAG TPA: hypothetical protein VML19_00945 [Verrucomicrobiae bacterium]|nr:hypothetical protein [Verrucomicrobiae bacterium]